MAIRLELLTREHRHLVKGFSNQHDSLQEYLHRFASRHASASLSKTWLAIDETPGSAPRIAGYFTIALTNVTNDRLAIIPGMGSLPSFPIPGILLARLAVDQRVQKQGVGQYLLEEALGLALQAGSQIPARLFVTDAIDEQAVSFYRYFGFNSISKDGEYPHKMVMDLLPLAGGEHPAKKR